MTILHQHPILLTNGDSPFNFLRINHCTALFDCDPVVMFQGLDSYNRSQWQKEPRRSVSLVNTEPVTVLP